MCPIAHVPHHPCAPSPKVPYLLSSVLTINHDTPLPMCPIAHMSKKMSSCQKDVKKDVKCQKVKHMDYGGGSQKK